MGLLSMQTTTSDLLLVTSTPRLLVQKFTLIHVVPVFSLTNPDVFGNRLRLLLEWGPCKSCERLLENLFARQLALPRQSLSLDNQKPLFCDQFCVVVASSFFSLSSNVAILNGISIWPDGNKPSKISIQTPWETWLQFQIFSTRFVRRQCIFPGLASP